MKTFTLNSRRRACRATLVALGAAGALVLSGALPGGASPLGPSNAQRHGAALATAKSLMGLVRVPGASSVTHEWNPANGPAPSGSGLPADPDLVDLTSYVVAPSGAAALRWLYAHPPHGGVVSSRGSSSGSAQATTYLLGYHMMSALTYLDGELDYAMALTSSGTLAIRVDAVVAWTPQKSPFALVAPGAATLTVRVDRGPNVKSGRVSTVRVTSASVIAELRAKVNALPGPNPGVTTCPIDFGSTMTLRFFLASVSNPYAVVQVDPSGCGDVRFSERALSGATLGVASALGGRVLARDVATLLGVDHWTGQPSNFATTH